ncbi:MAG: hypothetical protein LC637_08920 [Xanthomonadaceae bacterium]|nr:hypothetical protein [Xanthomonadaceae bacterium]
MLKKMNLTIAALAMLFAGQAVAQSEMLLPPVAGDLVANQLSRSFQDTQWPSRHTELARVSYQRSLVNVKRPTKTGLGGLAGLVDDSTVPLSDSTLVSESRQYFVDASGQSLAEGIELPLSAPGAIIRISTSDTTGALSLDRLRLSIDGAVVQARKIVERTVDGHSLKAAGLSVPTNTLAFRLGREAGAGILGLSVDGLTPQQPALVQVFEPNSPWVARLRVNSQRFLAGQPIKAHLSIQSSSGGTIVPATASAVLTSPSLDQRQPLQASNERSGSWQITAPERIQAEPGLYQVNAHAEAEIDGIVVRRDLGHAVAIAPPTARFGSTVSMVRGKDQSLSLEFPVEATISGRYQVGATLYATDKRGRLAAVATAETASVLPAAGASLKLDFDLNAPGLEGYGAPFEIRDLVLRDQGRMLILEQRQRALVLD